MIWFAVLVTFIATLFAVWFTHDPDKAIAILKRIFSKKPS